MTKPSPRARRMKKHTTASLINIVRNGSLSYASAIYELRTRKVVPPIIGAAWK